VAIGKDGAVRRQLRTLFNVGAVRELTDGQLLERFATDRGEAAELAFAVLIERHGPMVMRVCRGVLADPHDTQDAFQATFLVLVKRARGLWVRDSIGPWLHQVAYRTASCARTTAARHRRLERQAAIGAHESHADRDFELERLLHEEIDRLPERYRSPVVLCDLEGRTHEQAARHLGWPVGTVKSRLSRGRERLRDRLIRRGLAPEMSPLAMADVSKSPNLSIPPALLEATTAAAVRFAAIGTGVRGSAVTLAQGVLRTMSMTHWWKAAAVLLVAGATASGVEWLDQGAGQGPQAPASQKEKDTRGGEAPTLEVKPGKLRLVVASRGMVESAQTRDLYSNVEGATTIIKIVPEGVKVKKGDIVCELDSASLKDKLVNQRITAKAAEANYKNAKLAREVAEIALVEYKEGIYAHELADLNRQVDGGRNAIAKLEARLERTRTARQRVKDALAAAGGAKTPTDFLAELDVQDRLDDAELGLERERRLLAQAERKRDVLQKITMPKTVKDLEGDVRKTHSDELAREATWELEQQKEAKLERQIANCTLRAPADGCVVYANDPVRLRTGRIAQIEEGVTVREHQKILSIFDPDGPLQINAKVPEVAIAQVAPGVKAQVKIDACPNETLAGLIVEVAPLPDPKSVFDQTGNTYTTRIKIGRGRPDLRPGMTASAEIVVDERDEAIGVPVGALVWYDEKHHVAVKRPDGQVEWRDVVLGASDGKTIEIREGLKARDRVILDPDRFLTDDQRARKDAVIDPFKEKAAVPEKAKAEAPTKGRGAPRSKRRGRSVD
jgi:RND family efflux transporter MFP subunit